MSGNRQAAEKFIVKAISLMTRNSFNIKRYTDYFATLSDEEFGQFIDDLSTGKKFLTVQAPNFSETHITVENNIALGKQLGHSFFQKIWIGPKGNVPAYLSPVEYLIVDLPLRRVSQMLVKKISVSEHNRSVDSLSGQVAGDSKTSKISYPELQVAAAMDLDSSLVELLKYRGGDIRGGFAMDAMIKKYGSASIKTLAPYASGVESTKALKTFLNAAHLKSTL